MYEFLLTELFTISLFKNILNDKAVKSLISLLNLLFESDSSCKDLVSAYCGVYSELIGVMPSPDFNEYVSNLILYDENPFTLSCEKRELHQKPFLHEQAEREYSIMEKLALISCGYLKMKMKEKCYDNEKISKIIDELPIWNTPKEKTAKWDHSFISERIKQYEINGSGIFLKHSFFVWDGENKQPEPVKNPDPISLDRLYLVESQKDIIVKNTRMFLQGISSNNILLYGDRGTGKSSMVKALVNKFSDSGLRLVEVPCKYLDQIPAITSFLCGRGLKFILFIDDISFDNNEQKYTSLKAVLEGSTEHKPGNILLYATSNRRHLVKETFADRKGIISDNPDEEVRARDNIQEKLSLSDRFGITVIFSSPLKKEYLEIVRKMAEDENINMEPSLLELKAMQWELAYNGMTPRTARQFINWLKGEQQLNQ